MANRMKQVWCETSIREAPYCSVLDGTTGTSKSSPIQSKEFLTSNVVHGAQATDLILSLQISESVPNSNIGPHVSELLPASGSIPVADHRHMTLNSELILGCKSYCASKVNSRFRKQNRPPLGTCGKMTSEMETQDQHWKCQHNMKISYGYKGKNKQKQRKVHMQNDFLCASCWQSFQVWVMSLFFFIVFGPEVVQQI